MIKNITSFAISYVNNALLLTYAYDEINETGQVVRNNVRGSRYVVNNAEIKTAADSIEKFVVSLVNS